MVDERKYDFYYRTNGLIYGLRIMGIICLVAGLILFFNKWWPYLQLLSLPLILLSANFFIGSVVALKVSTSDYMTLPFVDLFSSDNDLVLDAGCGAGRVTIELSKVLKNGSIVALDLFDPKVDPMSGGRDLLEKNLEIAGINDRVQIVQGDVTHLEFENNTFDSATSALLLNNLGKARLSGLQELHRVLKEGGKLLVIVPVPSLHTFAMMSIFCFAMTSGKKWQSLFKQAGFSILEEGDINFGRYFLLQK
ncbi:class I SAM-dependent methyltransferase [Methanolobus sp. WCC4]|uniref:class I SAM-dependent methyltransferase n=1 Tax=Methanolobus sp. WCC4 TaxID=3125784 RepID=UPI0030F939BD